MTPKAQVKRGRRFVDNGHVVTTAGISAGIDGSLHVVARLLGRRVADQVATYMEYAWVPEASLATGYSYFNPSTDELGRLTQNGDLQYDEKRYADAEKTFRTIAERSPKSHEAWANLAETLSKEDRHADAADAFVRSIELSEKGPALGWTYYRAAGENAQAGRKDQAITLLGKAFENGYANRSGVAADERFASIVSEARVQQMLASR
jgi:tetratricopeptide (TPR) repeat protein